MLSLKGWAGELERLEIGDASWGWRSHLMTTCHVCSPLWVWIAALTVPCRRRVDWYQWRHEYALWSGHRLHIFANREFGPISHVCGSQYIQILLWWIYWPTWRHLPLRLFIGGPTSTIDCTFRYPPYRHGHKGTNTDALEQYLNGKISEPVN